MAATAVDISRADSVGNNRSTTLKVTLDASYPTGGYAFTPAQFGLASFVDVSVEVITPSVNAQYYTWDAVNSKIKLWVTAGTEVANATSVATAVLRVVAIGKG